MSRLRRVSRIPIVYGGVEPKSYILEVVGCGVAFLDYDNDGWLDIFVLSGTRLEGAPAGATNRLYKNNRNGTFTDVTEKAGLKRAGLGIGCDCWRLQQRRVRRSLRHLLRAQRAVPEQRRRHVHRCDRDRRVCGRTPYVTAPAARGWTTTATDTWICSSPRTSIRRSRSCRNPARTPDCRWRGVPVNCGPRGLPTGYVQLFHNNGDGTFTDVSRAVRRRGGVGFVSDDGRGRGLRQRRLAGHLRGVRFHAQLAVPQSARRDLPRGRARARCRAERGRPRAGWHGRRRSATTISTATSTSSRRTSPTTPTSSTGTTARATSTT